jgi:hypothetical protein
VTYKNRVIVRSIINVWKYYILFVDLKYYIHVTVYSGTVKDVLISREGSQVAARIDADTYSSYHSNSRFPQIL